MLLLVRPLPQSSIIGSCLFESISSGLAHILKHDISAFGACSSRSVSEGIQALTDPAILRSLACDHLEGPFADMPLGCLHGQSPRRAVLEDYVAHGYPLVDAEWTPPETNPKQPHQIIQSYTEYIKAMRKRSAFGDENNHLNYDQVWTQVLAGRAQGAQSPQASPPGGGSRCRTGTGIQAPRSHSQNGGLGDRAADSSSGKICMAASADLLGLRHIIFDTRAQTILGAINERAQPLLLCPFIRKLNNDFSPAEEYRFNSIRPYVLR